MSVRLESMKKLTYEILEHFPEVCNSVFDGDEDLPYLMMGHLADWVVEQAASPLDSKLQKRIVDFCNWCLLQPRGESADDDILTIWTVGFYEKMFENEATHPLIARLVTKEDLLSNREYLLSWVGEDMFQKVLKTYETCRTK